MGNGDALEVISVYGLGGVGKTTLAQLAFNEVRGSFEKAIWVSVNDHNMKSLDVRSVASSIIRSSGRANIDLSVLEIVQQALKQILKDRKFLIVLDDVWTEDQGNWRILKHLMSVGAGGSKVIVTKRSERVAEIVGTAPHLHLKCLSEDICWRIFESRAFGTGDAERMSFHGYIGRDIVKKCGGLPLAAEALGSLMRFKKEYGDWLVVRDSEIWDLPRVDIVADEANNVIPALMLSYTHLPAELKACFAYCSVFPKGHEVKMDVLLMHDLARSITGDQCSIIGGKITTAEAGDISKNLRYMSYINVSEDAVTVQPGREKGGFRLFYAAATSGGIQEESIQHPELLDVAFDHMRLRALHLQTFPMKELSVRVGKLKHLRYLNLSYTDIEGLPPCVGRLQNLQTLILFRCSELISLPGSIGQLRNLSYLNLASCTNLQSLPGSIGDLHNLRELNLTDCTGLLTLPVSIGSLSNLVELRLRNCDNLICMPKGLGCLTRLRTMPKFVLGGHDDEAIGGLGSLKALNSLQDDLEITHLERARSGEAREARLWEKQGLCELIHSWNNGNMADDTVDDTDIEEAAEGVLDGLQPPRDITELCIEGFPGKRLPTWITIDPKFPRLSLVILASFPHCETIPILVNLRCLRYLKMSSLRAIRRIGPEEFCGSNHGSFSGLEVLFLSGMASLEEWVSPPGTSDYPNLQFLAMKDCPMLRALPSSFPALTELKLDGLASFDGTLPLLPSLEVLRMEGLPKLRTLPLRLPALQELNISNSAALEEWAPSDDGFPSLAKLVVKGCPGIKALPCCFRELQRLELVDLASLEGWVPPTRTSRSEVVDDASSPLFPSLGSLILQDCPRLRSPLASSFPALKNLKLAGLDSFDGALPLLPSLEFLRMEDLPELRALPSSHTALKYLEISNLDSLEEWTPNNDGFPSLAGLSVKDCPGLRALPCCFRELQHLELYNLASLEGWAPPADYASSPLFPYLGSLTLLDCPRLRAPLPCSFPAVTELEMDFDNEPVLASIDRGGFQSLRKVTIFNCNIDEENPPPPPEAIRRRGSTIAVDFLCQGDLF